MSYFAEKYITFVVEISTKYIKLNNIIEMKTDFNSKFNFQPYTHKL